MDARWNDFVDGIFLTNLGVSDIFLSNQNFIILYYSDFHSFFCFYTSKVLTYFIF